MQGEEDHNRSTAFSSATSGKGQIEYHIAGWRIIAALVDFIPLAILFFVMAIFLGEIETEGASFNATLDESGMLHFMGLVLMYYILMESATGTTLGKLLLGLKVVKINGEGYGLKAVLIRNLLRIIDGLPVFYLVGIVSIGMTTRKQRLGDLAAGTQVVRVIPNPHPAFGDTNLQTSAQLTEQPTDNRWKVSMAPRMVTALLIAAIVSGFTIYLFRPTASVPTLAFEGLPEGSLVISKLAVASDVMTDTCDYKIRANKAFREGEKAYLYTELKGLKTRRTASGEYQWAFSIPEVVVRDQQGNILLHGQDVVKKTTVTFPNDPTTTDAFVCPWVFVTIGKGADAVTIEAVLRDDIGQQAKRVREDIRVVR